MKIAAYVHWRRTCNGVTGVGRHIRSMVMALSRRSDVELTVMAARQEMPAPNAPPDDPARDNPLTALPIVPLPFSRAILERLWWAVHMPRAERYVGDVDWVYSPMDAYVPTRKASQAPTIHDVETCEDDLPWSFQHPTWARARRRMRMRWQTTCKHAGVILTVSQFSKDQMVRKLGLDAKRIAVVGNGIDEFFYAAAKDPQTDIDAQKWREQYGTYFATVGGLQDRKGAPYLFDLADELRKRGQKDIKILVSGRNAPKWEARLPATPNIVPLGFVADEKLPGFLRGAAGLLFLSRYEGFGIPIVEAMASGTPVIAARFASLPEVTGDAGIIVDVSKVAEMADVVQDVASNPARRQDLIARGHRRAQDFTWDQCAAHLIDAMKRANAGQPQP